MKTRITELRVLYEDPTPQISETFARSISTMRGDLMTSRLRAMISTYGERVLIPNTLVQEIVRNRDKLSRRLKVTQRELAEVKTDRDALEEALSIMAGVLAELSTCSEELCDIICDIADEATLEKMTDKLEATREALESANTLFATEEESDCMCDDYG